MTELNISNETQMGSQGAPLKRAAQWVYAVITLLFAGGIVLQVFFAGAGALVHPNYWDLHRVFAHFIELLPLVMLLAGLVARLPRGVNGLSLLLFLLFILQYVFLYAMPGLGLPVLRALHAVNALVMFSIAFHLARLALRLLRSPMAAYR